MDDSCGKNNEFRARHRTPYAPGARARQTVRVTFLVNAPADGYIQNNCTHIPI